VGGYIHTCIYIYIYIYVFVYVFVYIYMIGSVREILLLFERYVLQSVAECCRVLQSVAECCRVLQYGLSLSLSLSLFYSRDTV